MWDEAATPEQVADMDARGFVYSEAPGLNPCFTRRSDSHCRVLNWKSNGFAWFAYDAGRSTMEWASPYFDDPRVALTWAEIENWGRG